MFFSSKISVTFWFTNVLHTGWTTSTGAILELLQRNDHIFIDVYLHHTVDKLRKQLRYRKSKKYRECYGQKKTDKRTNNNQQNTTLKITKDLATRTQLKTGDKPRWPGREGISCSIKATLQTWWLVMNEQKTGLWLRQTEAKSWRRPLNFLAATFYQGNHDRK